jgi:hypothetical protein
MQSMQSISPIPLHVFFLPVSKLISNCHRLSHSRPPLPFPFDGEAVVDGAFLALLLGEAFLELAGSSIFDGDGSGLAGVDLSGDERGLVAYTLRQEITC